jgi:hypothetical protein
MFECQTMILSISVPACGGDMKNLLKFPKPRREMIFNSAHSPVGL